jgi:hypothetical protein
VLPHGGRGRAAVPLERGGAGAAASLTPPPSWAVSTHFTTLTAHPLPKGVVSSLPYWEWLAPCLKGWPGSLPHGSGSPPA